jgi:hypothetical protein
MADQRILSRRNSYSYSEASDAGSSSTSTREIKPDTSVRPAPVVRSGSAEQRASLVSPSNSPPLPVHGSPAPAIAVPQQASGLTISKIERPEWEWDAKASILTLNKIFHITEEIRTLLINYRSAKHIIVQPDMMPLYPVDVINLLETATNATSIHFTQPTHPDFTSIVEHLLTDDGGKALANLAKKNPALTKLSFQKLPLDPSAFFFSLANGLKDNLTIDVIEISDNVFKEGSSAESPLGNSIADLLIKNRGIKTIIASKNGLSRKGAEAIGAALATNKSLTTLDLGDIDSDGAKAVFDGLRKNKKSVLSKLDLSKCGMDAQSAKSLGKLLKQNTSLKEIIVGDVEAPEGKQYIADGLQKNKSGCNVRFVGNSQVQRN